MAVLLVSGVKHITRCPHSRKERDERFVIISCCA